ncbi:MAG: nucleotidyltransferase family protein [Myxococcales bacterium]|nr:nucleotidyltransferase family protein [Myxococcales bacterium]
MTRELRIAGLIPAAGASRRLGRDKRRLPVGDGRCVLEVTVDTLRSAGLEPLVVVLEPDSPCAALSGLAGARLVTNPEPSRGMLSSIRHGLRALPGDVDAVAIQPGDHPFVPIAAVVALAAELEASGALLLRPRYGQRAGHPLLLLRALFEEAMACDDGVGLRQLVARRRADLRELRLELDAAAEDDLDEPADLARLERLRADD